jgi:enoyl-CoA hydratase
MSAWAVEVEKSVALLTFTRPPDATMDFVSMAELGEILTRLSADERVKVVVLTGGLDGFFINHGDPGDLLRASRGKATAAEAESWPRTLDILENIPQPTVAAIDGLAAGGGNEIALACTLRVGSVRASLRQPEITVGIIPGGGASVRLPRVAGPGVAAEAILTGRVFSAEEALRSGWLNAVLPTEDFVGRALRWVGAVAQHPAPALRAARRVLTAAAKLSFADAIALERQIFVERIVLSEPSIAAFVAAARSA